MLAGGRRRPAAIARVSKILDRIVGRRSADHQRSGGTGRSGIRRKFQELSVCCEVDGIAADRRGSAARRNGSKLNIGAGARWQGGVNWGVRPELKVFVSDNSSVRFSVGLYYQFGR